jgi:serine/threonine-protein kinase RsbW
MGKRDKLTIPGRYEEIKRVCDFVAEGAARAGLDEDDIFHVQLACDEACTNVIEHTYEEEDAGDISVSWEIGQRYFTIIIRDRGEPFDPQEIPAPRVPPVPADAEDLMVGGLGVYFMRQLMDRVHFAYDEGRGNVLTMEKKLPGKTE